MNRLASLTATLTAVFALSTALAVGPASPAPALSQQPPGSADRPTWVGTWSAAPNGGTGTTGYAGFTIRNLVHTSVGGDRVRVKLSNAFGTEPVLVEHTTVGIQRLPGSAAVAAGTLRDVTFDGTTAVTIPAGAEIYSDPVALRLGAASDLFVTTFTPQPSGPVTYHAEGLATSYFATDGADHAASVDGSALTETTTALHYVTEVDVEPGQSPGAVVTLGDSITDGVGSGRDLNRRYPDVLAARLRAEGGDLGRIGVLNAGISGNRVLLDGAGVRATERVERDVLQRAGASSVIVLLGINDIQQDPHQLDPDKIIAGLRQIARDSRDAGLTVIGGTITPFKGWFSYSPEQEATRQAVNDWIRTSDELDAVADFDETIRDPQDPQRMLPRYDSGDHLHPGEAGLAAMAGAVDLTRLGTPGKVLPGEPAPVERSIGVASSPQSAVAIAGRPAEVGFSVRAVVQKPGSVAGTLTTVVDGHRTVTPFETASEGRLTQVDLSPTVRLPEDAGPGTRTVRFEVAVEGGGRAVTTSELELVAVGCAQDDDVCPVDHDHDHDSIASAADDRDGNFDGQGWSYAAETLPAPGATMLAEMAYAFPSGADGDDNTVVADGKTIDLPDLRSDRLHVLASAGNGSVDETATVTYTDGSTADVSLAFSDWAQGAGSGEHVAVRAPYRLRAGVGRDGPAVNIYGRANELDPSRTVSAMTLPDESRLKIFALTLEVAAP
ncbi:SGNH/GDSL hydrolase family protein [Promicromonospora vindobonensis]|uniref:SGNH/GDSL hydrolase family protein n=1 Tax=Promicromonospora vindobonensis TaxID=195748 RepID=A0ABW5VYK4_9MICO